MSRALGQVKLERTGEARALFSAVIERYPTTSAAGRARAELKNISSGEPSAPVTQ
jgi:TolA-binding protein